MNVLPKSALFTPALSTPALSSFLQSPFEALHWNAQDLADAVPPRLHALFADGVPASAANDARAAAPRRWHRGYLRQRDLPARIVVRN